MIYCLHLSWAHKHQALLFNRGLIRKCYLSVKEAVTSPPACEGLRESIFSIVLHHHPLRAKCGCSKRAHGECCVVLISPVVSAGSQWTIWFHLSVIKKKKQALSQECSVSHLCGASSLSFNNLTRILVGLSAQEGSCKPERLPEQEASFQCG